LRLESPGELHRAVVAVQQCLTQVAMLKAICGMFDRSTGSRGSHCILDEGGIEMHPALVDPAGGRPYRFRPENTTLRNVIIELRHNPSAEDLFDLWEVAPRPIPDRSIAFEPAWAEFRNGDVYRL
jgi:hypothetical protein